MSDPTASRIVYLNGQFLPIEQAKVSVMDRGFLFGDGVYEVIPIFYEQLFRPHQHLLRLFKSLEAIKIKLSLDEEALVNIFQELFHCNHTQGQRQALYVQITRGAAPYRDHVFPEGVSPTIFAQCTPMKLIPAEKLQQGGSAITVPDIRWHWCYIKAITLLPNCLFAQEAKDQGTDECIWIRDGFALEGSSSNLFIVKSGLLITPPLTPTILGGITRDLLLELAHEQQLDYREAPIALDDLRKADEVWLTSSTKEILPITRIDQQPVGDGQVGPVWHKMKLWYEEFKKKFQGGVV